MSDEVVPDYHDLSADEVAALRDGDIIRLRPPEVPGRREDTPLTIRYEIKVATGERAEVLNCA